MIRTKLEDDIFLIQEDDKFWLATSDDKRSNKYQYISEFNEGFARVRKGNKWGFISKDLKCSFFYNYVSCFKNKFAKIYNKGKWGYIDENFKEIKPQFDDVWDFKNDMAKFEKNKKYGFVNKYGKKTKLFDYADYFCDGFGIVKDNGKYFILDNNLKILGPYDYISRFVNDLSIVEKNNKYMVINKKLQESKKYDKVCNIDNGIAMIKKGDKWGYINKDLKEIEPQFDEVWDFEDDIAIVKKNNKLGFIDRNYRLSKYYNYVSSFFGDIAFVIDGDRHLFLNKNFDELNIKVIYGYKGMDENMMCRDMQYKVGEKYYLDGDIDICDRGFHFCYNLIDCYDFYPKDGKNRFFKVKVDIDKIDVNDSGKKLVSNNIEILEEILDFSKEYKGSYEV